MCSKLTVVKKKVIFMNVEEEEKIKHFAVTSECSKVPLLKTLSTLKLLTAKF